MMLKHHFNAHTMPNESELTCKKPNILPTNLLFPKTVYTSDTKDLSPTKSHLQQKSAERREAGRDKSLAQSPGLASSGNHIL